MCSLRVESVCLHFFVKKKKIEIVDFGGMVGLRIYLDRD